MLILTWLFCHLAISIALGIPDKKFVVFEKQENDEHLSTYSRVKYTHPGSKFECGLSCLRMTSCIATTYYELDDGNECEHLISINNSNGSLVELVQSNRSSLIWVRQDKYEPEIPNGQDVTKTNNAATTEVTMDDTATTKVTTDAETSETASVTGNMSETASFAVSEGKSFIHNLIKKETRKN